MKLAPFLVFGLLAACGGSGGGMAYKLNAVDNAIPAVPKDPATCDFKIGKGPDDGGKYDKMGELTAVDFAAQSADELKGSIKAQVCQLGGDYVIAVQNETGNYKTATVLRKHVDAPEGAGSGAPAPAPAPAGSAAP
jgi:hypothetical protein